MSSVGLRTWILTIILALSFMSILKGEAIILFIGGAIICLIPLTFSKIKNKAIRVFSWLLIILVLYWIIFGSVQSGVIITGVETNSTSFTEGLRQGMIINGFQGEEIKTIQDFVRISEQFNNESKETRINIQTKDEEFIFLDNGSPDISVKEIPRTRLKVGLDLGGGARALVRPVNVSLSQSELNDLIAITNQRLNIFGIADVNVRSVNDLNGNRFMLVEVAGASPSDLRELLSQQGKFEASVGNSSVFLGGEKDIADVCRNRAECAAITQCSEVQGGFACTFQFTLYLTPEAAQKHADVTKNLTIDNTGRYLSEKLYLYVDDKEVDSLLIGTDLKGRVTTEISIQGSGTGTNREQAYDEAKKSMNKLQTILLTGSLPYKLEIVKLDSISPTLGNQFNRSLVMLGLIVFAIVSVVIFIKYRKLRITSAVILTMFSEASITLGIASLIGWNLDAPGIAGIIAGIGIGVNDQIVILDESTSGRQLSIKERIKRALFVIFGAFLTIVAAMLPLFWAGAGLLKGFALTTILGVTIGILVTRPAFAEIIRKIEE